MGKLHVEFLDRRTTGLMIRTDAYAFQPAGRLAWLQRLFWRFLLSNGALERHYDRSEKVEVIKIDTDNFMERLDRQLASVAVHFDHSCETVLIGAKDFAEMMSCMPPEAAFNFQASRSWINSGRHEVWGVEIRVIPWMSGMVVI